ncbi:ChaB family protein [Rhodococcus sp. NPDC058514]|uniref:ChaB family protein n=1 Tax=unclassified Rhodococcus (in: high G+C Gram-positive bacteria) TaxID=192944 RepID=UPI003662D312
MNRTELPQTLRRSSKEVQAAFAAAHDTALKRYGEGEDALRAAYGELKHDFELETDHWVPKQG